MRKAYLLAAALGLATTSAAAKEPQPGTIVSENSVACDSQLKNKKETAQVLCREYVVRTETTEYHVRQEKHADQELIPANTGVEFTLDKGKNEIQSQRQEIGVPGSFRDSHSRAEALTVPKHRRAIFGIRKLGTPSRPKRSPSFIAAVSAATPHGLANGDRRQGRNLESLLFVTYTNKHGLRRK
jgi:hypothetical protein